MKTAIVSATFAAALTAVSILPLNAAPVFALQTTPATQSDVEDVQYREWPRQRQFDRRFDRREARRDFYRDGNRYYYRGHRGYRGYRDGYREYNGWWFPASAFIAGALITGAINDQPRYGGGNAHVQWCYDRYRSYRAFDNSWQPNYGPRRECNSPYG